jgi:hypothetical protein
MNIVYLISAPATFSLALPAPLQDGTPTATAAQVAIHNAIMSIDAQWGYAGSTATRQLYTVGTRTKVLSEVEALIAQYNLPLHILHAQDAYSISSPDPADPTKTITTTKVHKQGSHSTIIKYMPDVVTYKADGVTVLSTASATVITLPTGQGQAPWML